VPLVVLAAEIHDWVPTRTAQAQDEAWHEFQVRLSKLTEHGRLELVRGGHNIQLDRPGRAPADRCRSLGAHPGRNLIRHPPACPPDGRPDRWTTAG
jgi:hypothetical protein